MKYDVQANLTNWAMSGTVVALAQIAALTVPERFMSWLSGFMIGVWLAWGVSILCVHLALRIESAATETERRDE